MLLELRSDAINAHHFYIARGGVFKHFDRRFNGFTLCGYVQFGAVNNKTDLFGGGKSGRAQ